MTVVARAQGAAGIVLDVDTGEVLALASLPTFNPNTIGMSGSEHLRNHVTRPVYELARPSSRSPSPRRSTPAPSPIIARRFDATAPLQIGGFTIHDDRGDRARSLNVPETLIHSSNIVTAQIADELGPARLQAMFRQLGFDEPPAHRTARARPPALAAATGRGRRR